MSFTLGDLSSVLATPTGYPFIQIYYNATQNYSGTNFMVAIPIILLTCACIAEIATASRQLWSFARDKGPPFSTALARVSPLRMTLTYKTPAETTIDQPHLQYPPQRHPPLPRRVRPPIPHQHRFLRRPQRHPQPHNRQHAKLLPHLHLLHLAKTPQKRTPSAPSLVFRSLGRSR